MIEPTADDQSIVIIVDRIVDGVVPDYSIYGTTVCPRCGQMVWVGHETGRKLMDPNVRPLCMHCARDIQAQAPDTFNPSKVVDHVDDGPCPKCGKLHRP